MIDEIFEGLSEKQLEDLEKLNKKSDLGRISTELLKNYNHFLLKNIYSDNGLTIPSF